MSPESSVAEFPIACERCAGKSAMPFIATTLSNGRTQVGMRCRACGHEWSFEIEGVGHKWSAEVEIGYPLLTPKPDRRKPER